ncbi:hypothetical protein ANCDUO_01077 [Ancylostoma duodenale]|uniref:Uncharacterized protein n=1 Tax=Ancylostoma duodenale TaxID=51022 RepID=A0A0C2H429_9BILA|nr:hypothetical protein ANCDUO_01077 [Ancylostoma duodenale]
MPFYKNDLKLFYQERALGDPSAVAISGPRRIIVIAHGVLIGVFGIYNNHKDYVTLFW